ncbi:hypothetical protein ACGFRB_30885 [Streptomyces sp. NPDC048718]|uniref:hypothetical protein n=1 Tax=Streptomyces sp. NPDC048718 TaxID=3365587 RepID=UPI00371D767A
MDDLDRLAAELRRLPPSCGPVRLVAIDGHAGSGKSTLAARLAAALGGADDGGSSEPTGPGPGGHTGTGAGPADRIGARTGPAPVLHLDDLATHDEPFAWTDRMLRQVLGPLSRGESALYSPYDWDLRRFGPPRPLPPAPVVLVEGVGAGRRALRPHLARLLWMERGPEESWVRGRRRDGLALSDFWDGWTVAETRHFAGDPSRPFADTLVRECQEGYVWRPGPSVAAGTHQTITYGDNSPAAN